MSSHLISAFNAITSNPGQFIYLLSTQRQKFISQLLSKSNLHQVEYFVQFDILDLTSIYCPLVDTFKQELESFRLLPTNEVDIEWMLRAREFFTQYSILYLINEKYGYHIAKHSIHIITYNFFHLRQLFWIFISDVLTVHDTSATSAAQLFMYYKHHLFFKVISTEFSALFQRFSTSLIGIIHSY